ncbi:MAG: hypothetical protein HC802_19050 [Caldilineaceae bacterium]|nr:hypothetical protein [Caldilineaceae bacterium]
MSWYMRLYPNSKFYGANPNSDSMSAPVIIVGPKNYEKVRPYVERDYVKRTYQLVWWPDQGYFGLTWGQVWDVLRDPQRLNRLFQIAFYRRYYEDDDPTKLRALSQWPNRHDFEMYVRRDIAAEIWDLGVAPLLAGADTVSVPPEKEIDLAAFALYNAEYDGLPLNVPRSVAVGADGQRVIADSGNHRIVVLDAEGGLLQAFGSHCRLGEEEAGGCVDPDGDGPLALGDGQFFEPWGVAVDDQGRIFVADTWNGRIQVFDEEGRFLRKWGVFSGTNGELGDANLLFGPRGLEVTLDGNLLVADTGNKRILKFTPEGELIQQIGGGGVILGRFEEPVDVAVHPTDGSIYVSDSWNRRIQKFDANLGFPSEILVPGWQSQDIYDKPYLAVAANGDIYASDPEYFRILVFRPDGELKAAFGDYGTDIGPFWPAQWPCL